MGNCGTTDLPQKIKPPPDPPEVVVHDRPPELACADVTCCARPSIIDRYSRVLFPGVFMIFNFMYWVTYYNISQGDDFKG